MIGRIPYEFDKIYYPDYETFPLDIPTATVYLTRCSSGMLDKHTITMLCEADDKNVTGVYSMIYVVMTVDIRDGDGSGRLFFFIVGEPINWASVQACTMSYHRYVNQMQSSLSCSEPEIGFADAVMSIARSVVQTWREQ